MKKIATRPPFEFLVAGLSSSRCCRRGEAPRKTLPLALGLSCAPPTVTWAVRSACRVVVLLNKVHLLQRNAAENDTTVYVRQHMPRCTHNNSMHQGSNFHVYADTSVFFLPCCISGIRVGHACRHKLRVVFELESTGVPYLLPKVPDAPAAELFWCRFPPYVSHLFRCKCLENTPVVARISGPKRFASYNNSSNAWVKTVAISITLPPRPTPPRNHQHCQHQHHHCFVRKLVEAICLTVRKRSITFLLAARSLSQEAAS